MSNSQWHDDQTIGEIALRKIELSQTNSENSLEKVNMKLITAIEGYRRDIDNCLGEIRHKNEVLLSRDIEYGRICAERDRARNETDRIKDQIKRRIEVTNTLPDQQLALKSLLEWIEKNVK